MINKNEDSWAAITIRCPVCDKDVRVELRSLIRGKRCRCVCQSCGNAFMKTIGGVSTDKLRNMAEIKFTDGSRYIICGRLTLYEKYPGEMKDRMDKMP